MYHNCKNVASRCLLSFARFVFLLDLQFVPCYVNNEIFLIKRIASVKQFVLEKKGNTISKIGTFLYKCAKDNFEAFKKTKLDLIPGILDL